MQTTCPECSTTFRVNQDHLGARRGLVRCGTCNAVFNAYDTLLPELESPPDDDRLNDAGELPETAAESVTEGGADVPVEAASSELADEADAGVEVFLSQQIPADYAIQAPGFSEPESEPAESQTATAFISANLPGVADLPIVGQVERTTDSKAERTTESTNEPDILFEPLWKQSEKQPRTWKFWLYFLLALLLSGLLGLQAAYFLRAELVAAAPSTRTVLEALCRPLNCSVPLPRQLTKAAITASSLESDPENKSRVSLTLLLTNRTGHTQAWPQIMLTLSDVRQAPVAKQVFRPQTYLPKEVNVAAGMAADDEHEIRLDLDIGNLVASGYTLNLSYP